ncbi:serine hydrolase [bacterium]|nr:serine hydrolase [bacterium]
MPTFIRTMTLLIVLSPSLVATAGLPRSTPEEQGVASSAIARFVADADQKLDALHSVMVVRHGHVIAEGWWAPYHAEANHSLYSLSKSFTSTAVGLAIAEGKLSLDDEVLKFFPDAAPENPSGFLKAMRLRDLLRMNTGQQTEPPRPVDGVWTQAFLAHPVPFKPGTHFLYNTSATYMASAMVQKATGETVLDYLRPRLFEPLGITQPTWLQSPQGISTGGYGLSIRTEDIASFGQLYLQRGQWQGQQLVPAEWIDAATSRQTSNGSNPQSDWDQGYGYQFWRCRHGAYRGDGAFGQYCLVLPEQDAVIAITSGLKDMQAVLNLVWNKLLPAFESDALPPNPEAQAKLLRQLKALSLPTPANTASPPDVFGKAYTFEKNDMRLEALTLQPGTSEQDCALLTITRNGVAQSIPLGKGRWQTGTAAWADFETQPMAAAGGWTDTNQLTAKLCFYETPFTITLQLSFDGNTVQCESEANVGFGGTKPMIVKGLRP